MLFFSILAQNGKLLCLLLLSLFGYERNSTVSPVDSAAMKQLTRCVSPVWSKYSDSGSVRKNTSVLGTLPICRRQYRFSFGSLSWCYFLFKFLSSCHFLLLHFTVTPKTQPECTSNPVYKMTPSSEDYEKLTDAQPNNNFLTSHRRQTFATIPHP